MTIHHTYAFTYSHLWGFSFGISGMMAGAVYTLAIHTFVAHMFSQRALHSRLALLTHQIGNGAWMGTAFYLAITVGRRRYDFYIRDLTATC
jgi:hypothetical protein